MARNLVKKPKDPPLTIKKSENDSQTDIGMADFITKDDVPQLLMANNAALLQQYAYNQHMQSIQHTQPVATYYDPTPQLNYTPMPVRVPPRGPRTPIGPRTPPEESYEESPASPEVPIGNVATAGNGYQLPIQRQFIVFFLKFTAKNLVGKDLTANARGFLPSRGVCSFQDPKYSILGLWYL